MMLLKSSILKAGIAGVILTLCFAPFDQPYLVVIAFSILWEQIANCNKPKQVVLITLVFGYCHYLSSCYWISNALTTDINRFWWLIPPTLTAAPLALACYLLPAFYWFYLHRQQPAWLKFTCFAKLWLFAEIIRSNFFIPFPWHILGDITGSYSWLIGLNSLGGTSFSSLIVLFICFSCYQCYLNFRQNWWQLALLLVTTTIVTNFTNPSPIAGPKISVALPQVTVDKAEQHIKIAGGYDAAVVHNTKIAGLVQLSREADSDISIWPESQLLIKSPKLNNKYPWLPLDDTEQIIISGAAIIDYPNQYSPRLNNSLVVLNKGGVIERYNKHILTPFGEYIPWPFSLLPIPLITNGYGLETGPRLQAIRLSTQNLTILPLICYESIFSHKIQQAIKDSQLMVIISNDNWFGDSIGPYQHLRQAQLRAAELGTYVARSAVTGVTALIDNNGKIIEQIELFNTGVIKQEIVLTTKSTLYRQYGNLFTNGAIFVLTGIYLLWLVITRRGRAA